MTRFLIALLAFLVATAASAEDWCWDEAGRAQSVDPIVLRAIGAEESGCRAVQGKRNNDGTVDHGPMQINSAWLGSPEFRRLQVDVNDLYQRCPAAYIASWVVARCYAKFGVTWRAIGCYNATSYGKQMNYANRIYQRIQRYYRTGRGIC